MKLLNRSYEVLALGLLSLIASSSALAVDPWDASFTALTTKFNAMEVLAWGVLTVVVLGFTAMKLFRKFVSRST